MVELSEILPEAQVIINDGYTFDGKPLTITYIGELLYRGDKPFSIRLKFKETGNITGGWGIKLKNITLLKQKYKDRADYLIKKALGGTR